MAQYEQALNATLADEQKVLLKELIEYMDDHSLLREQELFFYAFKLGARIMKEILEQPRTQA